MNKCPKCQGEMEEGKILAGGSFPVAFMPSNFKLSLKNAFKSLPRLSAFKCKTCGFLEAYVK